MAIIFIILGLILCSFIVYNIGYKLYKLHIWNKGKCPKCGHKWAYGGVYIGKRIKFNYMCPNCLNYTGFIFGANEHTL